MSKIWHKIKHIILIRLVFVCGEHLIVSYMILCWLFLCSVLWYCFGLLPWLWTQIWDIIQYFYFSGIYYVDFLVSCIIFYALFSIHFFVFLLFDFGQVFSGFFFFFCYKQFAILIFNNWYFWSGVIGFIIKNDIKHKQCWQQNGFKCIRVTRKVTTLK